MNGEQVAAAVDPKLKARLRTLLEVGIVSTKLGFTSFGGTVAHLRYFHDE